MVLWIEYPGGGSLSELMVSVRIHRRPIPDAGAAGFWSRCWEQLVAGIQPWMTRVVFIRLHTGRLQRPRVRPLPGEDPKRQRTHPCMPFQNLTYIRTHHVKKSRRGGLTPWTPCPTACPLQPRPVAIHPLETLTLHGTPRPTPMSDATASTNPQRSTPPRHYTHEPLTPPQPGRWTEQHFIKCGQLPTVHDLRHCQSRCTLHI